MLPNSPWSDKADVRKKRLASPQDNSTYINRDDKQLDDEFDLDHNGSLRVASRSSIATIKDDMSIHSDDSLHWDFSATTVHGYQPFAARLVRKDTHSKPSPFCVCDTRICQECNGRSCSKLQITWRVHSDAFLLVSARGAYIEIHFHKFIDGKEVFLPNSGERERLSKATAGTISFSTEEEHVSFEKDKSSGLKSFGITWKECINGITCLRNESKDDSEGGSTAASSTYTTSQYLFPPETDSQSGHGVIKTNRQVQRSLIKYVSPWQFSRATRSDGITLEELWWHKPLLFESKHPIPTKCCVLQCHHPENDVRGQIICIGRFCQGILVQGSHSTVERWENFMQDPLGEYREKKTTGNVPNSDVIEIDAENSNVRIRAFEDCAWPWGRNQGQMWEMQMQTHWMRLARIGDLFLPCSVAFRSEILVLGTRVTYGDFIWEVVENSEHWMSD